MAATTATAPAPAVFGPFRFTREMYYRMGEAGIFEGVRVELLDGEIIQMSPQSVPHAGTITRLTEALIVALRQLFTLRVQLPIVLSGDSEPEPDFAVCDRDSDGYLHAHPTAGQVHLIIEVAYTSVDYDRGRKRGAYARAGIPQYWPVNLPDKVIEVYAEPDRTSGLYRISELRRAGDRLELPGGATLEAADFLPSA